MNCERGDIAIVVKGYNNLSKVLTCIRLVPMIEVQVALACKGLAPKCSEGNYWEVDVPIMWSDGVKYDTLNYIPDSFLRPIRDSDGEDEMVKLLGKPNDMIVA
jgi:hypothetical protein